MDAYIRKLSNADTVCCIPVGVAYIVRACDNTSWIKELEAVDKKLENAEEGCIEMNVTDLHKKGCKCTSDLCNRCPIASFVTSRSLAIVMAAVTFIVIY